MSEEKKTIEDLDVQSDAQLSDETLEAASGGTARTGGGGSSCCQTCSTPKKTCYVSTYKDKQ